MTDSDSGVDEQTLATDIVATIDALIDEIEPPDDGDDDGSSNPFGMNPLGIIEMAKPQLKTKVRTKPEKALRGLAVLHQCTDDILSKHAPDRDVQTMASEGLNE